MPIEPGELHAAVEDELLYPPWTHWRFAVVELHVAAKDGPLCPPRIRWRLAADDLYAAGEDESLSFLVTGQPVPNNNESPVSPQRIEKLVFYSCMSIHNNDGKLLMRHLNCSYFSN